MVRVRGFTCLLGIRDKEKIMQQKPILCLDFDGVLHSYSSGWQGADVIIDPPVEGALDFIREAVKHFEVHIFSSRSGQDGGIDAMRWWLTDYFAGGGDRELTSVDHAVLAQIHWPTEKPPAFVSIDDRCLLFTGVWPDKEIVKLEDGELTRAVAQLYGTRNALKLMVEQEVLLKDRVKELVAVLEYEAGTVFATPSGLQFNVVEVAGRKTLNKDKLIDAGVLPSQIEKGYKVGDPSTRVEVK